MDIDPRTKPERGTYELDRDHSRGRPASMWMFDEYAGAVLTDIAGQNLVGLNLAVANWKSGEGAYWSASGFSNGRSGFRTTAFTIIATLRPVSSGVRTFVGGALFAAPTVRLTTDNRISLVSASNVELIQTAANSVPNGTVTHVAVTAVSGARYAIYTNGRQIAASTTTAGFNRSNVVIGTDGTSASAGYRGAIMRLAIYESELPRSLIEEDAAEPYGMLRPIVRRTYSMPDGGLLKRRRAVA